MTKKNNAANITHMAALSKKKKYLSVGWCNTISLCVLALPAFLWFLIFAYIPMFGSIIAFKNFDFRLGIFGSPWCGLDNFKYLFFSNDAVRILRNTVCYNALFIVVGMVTALTVALLLERVKHKISIKFYQSVFFMPYLISWVVAGFIAQGIFKLDGGILNNIRANFGLDPVSWYTDTKPWPYILLIANVWKVFGYNAVIYYGALLGIDPALYEAATIDGANSWQKIIKITIPMLKPTIMILFILAVGGIMRADFGLFYYVPNNSGPIFEVTDVIDTYIYRALKISGDIQGSSAASIFQSVVGLVLVVSVNAIVKKIDPDNALF